MARVFENESVPGKASVATGFVPLRTERELTLESANKIADALGCSMQSFKLEILFDWQHHKFIATTHALMTDEQGQTILEVLKSEPAAPQVKTYRQKYEELLRMLGAPVRGEFYVAMPPRWGPVYHAPESAVAEYVADVELHLKPE